MLTWWGAGRVVVQGAKSTSWAGSYDNPIKMVWNDGSDVDGFLCEITTGSTAQGRVTINIKDFYFDFT